MHTEGSGEKEAQSDSDSAPDSGAAARDGSFFDWGPVSEADIPAPAKAGEPWRIPSAGDLEEGHGRSHFLSRGPRQPVVEIILCRVDGLLRALDSECPHAGGRIQGGELVEGRFARCPLHWFDFDPADGRCVNVDCDSARTYRVEERGDCALIWLTD